MLAHMDKLTIDQRKIDPGRSQGTSSSSSSSYRILSEEQKQEQIERFGRVLPDSGLAMAYNDPNSDSNKGLNITHISKDAAGSLQFE